MRNAGLLLPFLLILAAAWTEVGLKEEIRTPPQKPEVRSEALTEAEASVEDFDSPERVTTTEDNSAIRIVRTPQEGGAGPLIKEKVSIGGIHIGDSQETVKDLLGEPSFIQEGGWGTPFVHWHYEQHNVYVDFFRTSETDPAGGVASISVSEPSSLKTDKNVGIGDSLSAILQAYEHVLGTEETDGVMNVYINGTHEEERFYVPQLHFLLKDGRITHFELTTNLIDPEHVK